MLRADADALRGLAKSLTGIGDSIEGIAAPPPVVMPTSAIQTAAQPAAEAVAAAYKAMAAQMHTMSAASDSNANNYEAADGAFSEQLQQYQAGLP